MKRIFIGLSFSLLINGCATLGSEMLNNQRKEISQAQIGCPASEITLGDQTDSSWTATCRKRRFFCHVAASFAPSGVVASVQQTCTEELKEK